jgi:hypothetical protein
MQSQIITCPNCGHKIELTEALSRQIQESLKRDFEEEKVKIENDAKQKALKSFESDKQILINEISEKQKKLEEAQKNELELRKRQKDVEEKAKTLELEIQRKLDEERKKIKEEASRTADEQYRFKQLEYEKLVSDLNKQIDEMKRKADQGSQQTQGEVLEIELEDILKSKFPQDSIEPVPKGVRGADVIQRIFNQNGQFCGTIIWESKRTKAWSDSWLSKLKDDQRECKAEIAILMSTTLPKGIKNFGLIDGVWITNFSSLLEVAIILRVNLIQLASAKLVAIGQSEKMDIIYNYLTSTQFKHKVEAIIEAFTIMKKDLDKEKKSFTAIWAKRETQIEKVISNTIGMYGELQGIMGASLPEIESLDITFLPENTDDSTSGS